MRSDIHAFALGRFTSYNDENVDLSDKDLQFFYGVKIMGRYLGKITFFDCIAVTLYSSEEEMLAKNHAGFEPSNHTDTNGLLLENLRLDMKYPLKLPKGFQVLTAFYTSGICYPNKKDNNTYYSVKELTRVFTLEPLLVEPLSIEPLKVPSFLLEEDDKFYWLYKTGRCFKQKQMLDIPIPRSIFIPATDSGSIKDYFNKITLELKNRKALVVDQFGDTGEMDKIKQAELCLTAQSYIIPVDSPLIVWKRDYSAREV